MESRGKKNGIRFKINEIEMSGEAYEMWNNEESFVFRVLYHIPKQENTDPRQRNFCKTTWARWEVCDDTGALRLNAFDNVMEKWLDFMMVGEVYKLTNFEVCRRSPKHDPSSHPCMIALTEDSRIEVFTEGDWDIFPTTIPYNFMTFDKIESQHDSICTDIMGYVSEASQSYTFVSRRGIVYTTREVTLVDRTSKSVTFTLWNEKADDDNVQIGVVLVIRGFKIMLIEEEEMIVGLLRCCHYIPTPVVDKPKLISVEVWEIVIALFKWAQVNVTAGAVFPHVSNIKQKSSQLYPEAMTYYLKNFPTFSQNEVAAQFKINRPSLTKYLRYFNVYSSQMFDKIKEDANNYFKRQNGSKTIKESAEEFGISESTLIRYRRLVGDVGSRQDASSRIDNIPSSSSTRQTKVRQLAENNGVNYGSLKCRRYRTGLGRKEIDERHEREDEAARFYMKHGGNFFEGVKVTRMTVHVQFDVSPGGLSRALDRVKEDDTDDDDENN